LFWLSLVVTGLLSSPSADALPLLHGPELEVAVAPDGSYSISTGKDGRPVLNAEVAAKINGTWVQSSEYPHHRVAAMKFHDSLGAGQLLIVSFTGLSQEPDLKYIIRLYDRLPFGDIEVNVDNNTGKSVTVQELRLAKAIGNDKIDLGGEQNADRIMSDSYSEDDPQLRIYDLGAAPRGLHLAVGVQLIYNRHSHDSLLLAALTSERFLTMIHLQTEKMPSGGVQITALTVDSAGTTEAEAAGPLDDAPASDLLELSLSLPSGKSLPSERVLFAAGNDYHRQLEEYGKAIRLLHHARVNSAAPMGWWSWTACYRNIEQNTALENARWLAHNLKDLGFRYFHIDAGYAYALGEYTTPDRSKFPNGMSCMGKEVTALGLRLGIWTAPFEVSERSQIYKDHRDWLVRNGQNQPLQIGGFRAGQDATYVLDTTHPDAQRYLRQTYQTMANEWGARYFKLDFMETTAVEGRYYRPNTTAVEAERIGLKIIREAVGDRVLLDKDGSPMLAPVGLVDEGRLSVDTGHSFWASQATAPGIAARYYMNRNFFISDPDAFTISRQSIYDHSWPDSAKPLTISDAQVSIVLAALVGGMYEIGDDLKILGAEPDRIALIKNPDLLAMVSLGKAAVPLDLMDYRDQDGQPSIFLLHENRQQSVLAVFNWTTTPISHSFTMAQLGLPAGHSCRVFDVLNSDAPVSVRDTSLQIINQPPHSVRVIKWIDTGPLTAESQSPAPSTSTP
jgi:hypothetical protein